MHFMCAPLPRNTQSLCLRLAGATRTPNAGSRRRPTRADPESERRAPGGEAGDQRTANRVLHEREAHAARAEDHLFEEHASKTGGGL